MSKPNLSVFNIKGTRKHGIYLENPIVQLIRIAKAKKVEYDNDFNLLPAYYDEIDFLDIVERCSLNLQEWIEKMNQWKNILT